MPTHFNPRFKQVADGCNIFATSAECQKQKLQDQTEKDGRFLSKLITGHTVKVKLKEDSKIL
jgi:hypothetical protein